MGQMEGSQHWMRRRRARRAGVVLVSVLAGVGVLAGSAAAQTGTAARPAHEATSPVACGASAIQATLHLANVTVASATMVTNGSYTPPGTTTPITGLPPFCAAALTQTDPAGNAIDIAVWLPAAWNGRFQGVGGGGYSCGISYPSLAAGIESGYATASTDCGVPAADLLSGAWALTSHNTLNWPLIDDFAFAGIHDMSVAGKAVTAGYYATAPSYSYFTGCSTGGREGLMEAQRYPADYNGIVSGAPAINWTRFIPAEIWPELVMNESRDFLPACKEGAFVSAAVQACASTGGVITNPATCDFNPGTLVGLNTP